MNGNALSLRVGRPDLSMLPRYGEMEDCTASLLQVVVGAIAAVLGAAHTAEAGADASEQRNSSPKAGRRMRF
jgi:hypothetical protein